MAKRKPTSKQKSAKMHANTDVHSELLPGLGGPPPSSPPPRPVSRQDMERFNRAVGKLLAEQDFATTEEANAFLTELTSGRPIDDIFAMAEETPEEQALELAFEAMEASSIKEAKALSSKALKLDPHCIDALLVQAEASARSGADFIRRLRTIVRDAERRFGTEYIEENRGHFWGMVETRPYMRARHFLVMALEEAGHIDKAIEECEGILLLNPNDNQGVRDLLRGMYLVTGDVVGVRRLNKEYPEELFATYAWSIVLERWIGGNLKQAENRARAAHKINPHVLAYLTGEKATSEVQPDYYTHGDETEAIVCASNLGDAWQLHTEARKWLKGLGLR